MYRSQMVSYLHVLYTIIPNNFLETTPLYPKHVKTGKLNSLRPCLIFSNIMVYLAFTCLLCIKKDIQNLVRILEDRS